jgi:hypothetical protein
MAIMSGCYDYSNYSDCGYEQNWDDCYKPRHHRPRRRHNECWDYSPSYCS